MVDSADGSDSVGHTLSPGCERARRGLRSGRRRPAGYRRPAIPVIGRPPPDLDRAEAGLGAIVPADHARHPLQLQARLDVDLCRRPDDHRVGRPFQGLGERDIEVKVDQPHPADSRFCPEGREPTDRAVQGWKRRVLQDIGDLRRRTGRAAEVVQRPTVVRPLVTAFVRLEPLDTATRRRLFRLDAASERAECADAGSWGTESGNVQYRLEEDQHDEQEPQWPGEPGHRHNPRRRKGQGNRAEQGQRMDQVPVLNRVHRPIEERAGDAEKPGPRQLATGLAVEKTRTVLPSSSRSPSCRGSVPVTVLPLSREGLCAARWRKR